MRVESVGDAERRREEIVRLLHTGLSGREIARRVGCSHGYVDKIRRELPDRAEPEAPAEPRWHGPPFQRLESAERERNALFRENLQLADENKQLRARLAAVTAA